MLQYSSFLIEARSFFFDFVFNQFGDDKTKMRSFISDDELYFNWQSEAGVRNRSDEHYVTPTVSTHSS